MSSVEPMILSLNARDDGQAAFTKDNFDSTHILEGAAKPCGVYYNSDTNRWFVCYRDGVVAWWDGTPGGDPDGTTIIRDDPAPFTVMMIHNGSTMMAITGGSGRAEGEDFFFTSTDNGETWNDVTPASISVDNIPGGLTHDGTYFWLSLGNNDNSQRPPIWRTQTGFNLEPVHLPDNTPGIFPGDPSWSVNALGSDTQGTVLAFAGQFPSTLWRSTDQGDTWVNTGFQVNEAVHDGIRRIDDRFVALQYIPNSPGGIGSRIIVSNDAGQTWDTQLELLSNPGSWSWEYLEGIAATESQFVIVGNYDYVGPEGCFLVLGDGSGSGTWEVITFNEGFSRFTSMVAATDGLLKRIPPLRLVQRDDVMPA